MMRIFTDFLFLSVESTEKVFASRKAAKSQRFTSLFVYFQAKNLCFSWRLGAFA